MRQSIFITQARIFLLVLIMLFGIGCLDQLIGQVTTTIYQSDQDGKIWVVPDDDAATPVQISEFKIIHNQIFATSNQNELYVSADRGERWKKWGDKLPERINGFAQKQQILFASQWGGGVFTSFNQGKSWQEMNFGLTNREVSTLFQFNQMIFAGTATGIFLTWNEGMVWMNLLDGVQVNDFATDGETLFAATTTGVLRCDDKGKSWNSVLENRGVRSLYTVGNDIYALTYHEGMLKLPAGGSTWESVNEGLPATFKYGNILVLPDQSLLFGRREGIYQLPKDGKSWRKVTADQLPGAGLLSLLVLRTPGC